MSDPAPPSSPSKPQRHTWIAHGSDWAEYEDFLIGDREGLAVLREAIDTALKNGTASLKDCDSEFVGVRVVTDHPERPAPVTWRDKMGAAWAFAMLLLFVFCLIYGAYRLPDLFK